MPCPFRGANFAPLRTRGQKVTFDPNGINRLWNFSEVLTVLSLPRSLAVESREADVPAVAERTGRKRTRPQRQAALVNEIPCAVDRQLNESFNHAIGLRPVRRAGKMQYQLVRCRTLQLGSIVTVEEIELIFSITPAAPSRSAVLTSTSRE